MLACGEEGDGRMAEPAEIVQAIESYTTASASLTGRTALVTAGPTHEPIDPVRYLGNRSSGKQGYAIAEALARHGARVTLVTGPVNESPPSNVEVVRVETAEQMLDACIHALPVDIAVCAAAVADWRAETPVLHKRKKEDGRTLTLTLTQTPDILATLALHPHRPRLLVGFAAETEHLAEYARAKRIRKGCDWLLANDVSAGKVFGKPDNTVYFITAAGIEEWPTISKREVAQRLVEKISEALPSLHRGEKAMADA
jgi:phosphopantothenoylcysteine decarboxylase/phosphopantothenate--cysteine ligase